MATSLTFVHPRLNHPPYPTHSPLSSSGRKFSRGFITYSGVSSPENKSRRKKQQPREEDASVAEKGLRLVFMEELTERASNRVVPGVSEVIYDMIAAGLTPGPRSFHGLIVSHTLNGDHVGAVASLWNLVSCSG